MTRRPALLAVASAALLAGCGGLGPYADVGQKLDVGLRLTGGEAWVSVADPDVRILVLGRTPDGLPSQFAFSVLSVPVGAGISNHTLQGYWQEHDKMILTEQTDYTLPNERSVGLNSRFGSRRRDDVNRVFVLDTTRTDRLTLGGDPTFAGTYTPLGTALAHLGTATASDAACAYYVANLTVMTAQVRILGFGGPAMVQYRSPETFEGTISGAVRVGMSGDILAPDVRIDFQSLVDFPGVQLDGAQLTHTDSGGNGRTEGTVRFTIQPAAPAPALTGAVLYDLDITNGFAGGGQYHIAIDGGASGTASPITAPSPPIATCLGLE